MKMNFDLSMQQTQKLVMTQQLQMAIKILQMPSVELNEYIDEQLVDNPVLEQNSDDRAIEDTKVDWKEVAKQTEYDENEDYSYQEDENVSPLNFVENVTTLRDHLLMQLHLSVRNDKDSEIGEYLIDNIDSSGYLRTSIQDVAACLNVDDSSVENVLKIIHTFDPPGIGARDIKECLLIQLTEQGILDDMLEKVVCEYLDEIAENRYGIIAKGLNITPKEAQALGDIIKRLEPKPGSGFADANGVKYIVPDVYVEKVGDDYVVIVNDRVIPRLSISPYYRGLLKSDDKDEKARDYVKRKLDSAAWLIRSIEQRKNTLYNVVSFIVSYQRDFLDKGIDCLKPLTLREVAEEVDIHESTVSRAISGKYVQTPRGLFQLKFFFSRGLDDAYGDNVSTGAIKKLIKEIIEGEDSKKPLSDQNITDTLNRDGINISRRTVAKYREEMAIPPTSKRKRL